MNVHVFLDISLRFNSTVSATKVKINLRFNKSLLLATNTKRAGPLAEWLERLTFATQSGLDVGSIPGGDIGYGENY
jgi:hypothetical protein